MIKKNTFSFQILAIILLAFSGCAKKKSSSTPTVNATARFFNGATPAGTEKSLHENFEIEPQHSLVGAPPIPADGKWFLSPDEVTLNVTTVQMGMDPSNSQNVTCKIPYKATNPGLTQLVDCTIALPVGTHTAFSLTLSPTYSVLINASTNGFYSTPTGIVTTAPVGGAQTFSTKFLATTLTKTTTLNPPLTVTTASTLTLSIVVQGLQFLPVTVKSGVVTLGSQNEKGDWALDIPDTITSVGSLAKVEFYSNAGTAGSSNQTGTSISVFYSAAKTPVYVGMAGTGSGSAACSLGVGFLNDPRAYVGLDQNGVIGWAAPTDSTWQKYSALLQMTEGSAIGDTTTLYCADTTTDPAPSGGTFASGAPSIATPGNSRGTLTLLAK